MKQLTKQEIVQDMVNFYSADPNRRSLAIGGGCVYNSPEGQHCAVGRCLLPEYQNQGSNLRLNGKSFGDFVIGHGTFSLEEIDGIEYGSNSHNKLLQEQYRGHDIGFWLHLQNLHDNPEHWNEVGLTENGIHALKTIEHNYNITITITLPK